MNDELPEEIKVVPADGRGRVTLGMEYANKDVRVAIYEATEGDDE